jgi:hypothetical protein
MKTYKCPVCGSELTKEHYQHALEIVDGQKAIQAERAEIAKKRDSREQREVPANRLIEFLTGQQFRNHIEGIVQAGRNLQAMLRNEAKPAPESVWRSVGLLLRGNCLGLDADQEQHGAGPPGKAPELVPQPRFKLPLLI